MLLNEPSYQQYEPAHVPPEPTEPVFQLDPRVVTLQSDTETLEVKNEAFSSIAMEHSPGLYRYAAKIVGPFDAEDVVQDTLLRAWTKVDTLKPTYPRSLPKWLYKIAYHTALNKKERSHVTAQLPEDPVTPNLIGDPVATQEFREGMASINDELPETQKQALMLRILGFSPGDIAERQNVSLIAAKARLQRGRAHAKSILWPVEDPESEEEADPEEAKAA